MRGILILAIVLLTATVCNAQQYQCENGVCVMQSPVRPIASAVVAPVVRTARVAVVAPVVVTQRALQAPVAIAQRVRPVQRARRVIKARPVRRIAAAPVRFVRRLFGCR